MRARGLKRLMLLAVLALPASCLALPATSQAKLHVDLLQGDDDPVPLVTFTTVKCRKTSKKKALLKFYATGKRKGYKISINVFKSGLDHFLRYGGDGPADFTVRGPEGEFTNLNRPPDAPPGGGAIHFSSKKKTKFGLGFSPTFNGSFSKGIDVYGSLKCKYPKKKKKR